MADQLNPPPDMAPRVPKTMTPQQCIAIWCDLMGAAEQLLLAGLRRQIGPDGDLRAAYREWYAREMEEHDRTLVRMLERLSQGEDDRVS